MTSGKHTSPRYLLTLSAEQKAEWQRAADWRRMTLAQWIRDVCDAEARASAEDHRGKAPRRKR